MNLDSELTPINLNVWSKGQWQPIKVEKKIEIGNAREVLFYINLLIEPKYNKEVVVNLDSELTPINLNVWSKGQRQPINSCCLVVLVICNVVSTGCQGLPI